jgi:hypothetical protein
MKITKKLENTTPKNQVGVLKKFIHSPNEAVALAKLMGSKKLAADLGGMLDAAQELVQIDQFDTVVLAAGEARIEWECAYGNVKAIVVNAADDEICHMYEDLGGIWRQALLYTTSSGDLGTKQYLTEWIKS